MTTPLTQLPGAHDVLATEPLAVEPERLRDALESAHLPTLLVAMMQLSGDDGWLRDEWRPQPTRGVAEDNGGGLPEDVQRDVRQAAWELVMQWREGRLADAPAPEPDKLVELLEFSLGPRNPVPKALGPLLAEELGTLSRDVAFPDARSATTPDVLVIGSGFAGLCAAIKLKRAGVPFTVVEKNDDLGGTWLENAYPGCGVDTPSHLYSFSFAQRPDWSRFFARRDDLHEYLEQLADHYDVREHIRFGREVTRMDWDEQRHEWDVTLRSSDDRDELVRSRVVIAATGFFNRPAYPPIDGLDTFAGPSMHTARWRSDVPIAGKHVAVLGTGASAMQLVPAIADTAERVTVFQRSPQWGIPNPNYFREVPEDVRIVMREVPYYLGWYRLRQVWNFGDKLHPGMQIDPEWEHPERAINAVNDRHRQFLSDYIRTELGEREDLVGKCLPTYPPYGKRPLLDNGWFRTVARDDVELVTDPVERVTPTSVITATGDEFEPDVLVIATGFQALNILGPMEVRGRSGRTLRETWGEDDARAYLGIAVPDYPNFFFLLGPNTFAGHGGSAALSIEMEVRYVMELLAHMAQTGVTKVECRQEAHDAYAERLDAALDRTIWAHRGMTTYYRNSKGRIVVPMPWTNADYADMTRKPDLDDYHLESKA